MEKENPEQEIARSNLLHKHNLYRLLVFLRNIYPIGYSIEGLARELGITLGITQLNEIEVGGLVRKRKLGDFEKKMLPHFEKFYPEYIITQKGLEFLNSIESQKLNKNIEKLTRILVWFGGITIFLILFQLVFQILQYLK